MALQQHERGIRALKRRRHATLVRATTTSHGYLTGTAGWRPMDRRTAWNPGSTAFGGRGSRVSVRCGWTGA